MPKSELNALSLSLKVTGENVGLDGDPHDFHRSKFSTEARPTNCTTFSMEARPTYYSRGSLAHLIDAEYFIRTKKLLENGKN
jgi:hypothetical protein